ncbi:MAG: helix-turn-helix domain-containing protein [Ruminococcus sp.]|nr:helix-turn-helix domain-containing protein [Ruminococcus sp.]
MDIGEVFGKRLLELRDERNETQEQLAKAVNITRQSLSRYEANERTPNIELIYNIAKHYEVSADYLLGLSEVKSLDNRVQAACEVTGLSEEAITAIIQLNEIGMGNDIDELDIYCSLKDALDMFITSDYSFSLLMGIANYNVSTKNFVKMLVNKKSNDDLLGVRTGARLQFFENLEDFRRILDTVNYPLYTTALNYYSEYCGVINGFEDNQDIIKQAEIELNELKRLYEEAENNGEHNPEDQ